MSRLSNIISKQRIGFDDNLRFAADNLTWPHDTPPSKTAESYSYMIPSLFGNSLSRSRRMPLPVDCTSMEREFANARGSGPMILKLLSLPGDHEAAALPLRSRLPYENFWKLPPLPPPSLRGRLSVAGPGPWVSLPSGSGTCDRHAPLSQMVTVDLVAIKQNPTR